MISPEFEQAKQFARYHAEQGLKTRPFDGVYIHTIDQLNIIDGQLASHGDLDHLEKGRIDVGLMAAKELALEEQDFGLALHIIQRYVDEATGQHR